MRNPQDKYLLIECWDGVPPTPEQLEEAAQFGVQQHERGRALSESGVGRSLLQLFVAWTWSFRIVCLVCEPSHFDHACDLAGLIVWSFDF